MTRIRTVADLRHPCFWYAFDAADTGVDLVGRGPNREAALTDLVQQLSLPQLQSIAHSLARAFTDLSEVRDIVQPELHRRGFSA